MILDKIALLVNRHSENGASEQTTAIEQAAAIVIGLLLLFVLLTTATQAVCFWIPNWWRNEYAKYDTPSNVRGEMSLDDAVHVTEDMLDYCVGRIDTLDDTEATIDGVTSPFFTDREKHHLADCRELFMKGLRARAISVLLILGLSVFLYVHLGRTRMLRVLSSGYLKALAAVLILALIVLIASIIDFTKVFTIFHKIFFDNDLWILYPDKDNLINIMQENVFSDAAMWIGGIWAACALVLAGLSLRILRKAAS